MWASQIFRLRWDENLRTALHVLLRRRSGRDEVREAAIVNALELVHTQWRSAC
jgi:hypothetical protein